MDTPEPEIIAINYPQNDTPIVAKFAYPDVKSLVRLFFVLVFYMLVVGFFTGIVLLATQGLKSPLLKSIIFFMQYVVVMSFVINYGVKKTNKVYPEAFNFSFNKIHAWLIPVIIISTLALVVGLEGISNILSMPVSVAKYFESIFKKDFFSVVTIVIAAPIMEEIICRGIVLKGLLKNYPPQKAIVISAFFFGLIHLNPWQALPAFFGGLFLGWIFYKTQSVIAGMITHATINGTSMLFFFFLPRLKHGFLNALGLPYYIVLCIVAVLVFVGGCVVIERKVKSISNERNKG